MAVNNLFRLRWRYVDANGKVLQQYPEASADFILNVVTGGDGIQRADMNDARTKVGNNFPTPAGASILFTVISNSQSAFAYS